MDRLISNAAAALQKKTSCPFCDARPEGYNRNIHMRTCCKAVRTIWEDLAGVAIHAPLSRTVLDTEDDDDPAKIESAKRAAAAAHTTSETMKTHQADSKTAQKYTRALDRVFDSRGVPDFLARWTPGQLLSHEVMKEGHPFLMMSFS